VSFAAGAAIPILPFLVTTGTAAIVAAGIAVGVALLATGATVGVLTGESLLRRGLRQLGIGAAAALVTYGLGRVFNTIVG
jgi:VIT1/CCC1 family predicted Fe2+/Mn2+ transporter